MPPKDYTLTTLQNWIKAETDKKHSMAIKYIEENVDLVDEDLQQFMNNCPTSCQLEVYEMLLKAGIDMTDYVKYENLKTWDIYMHDANQWIQQYKIDYKKELDEYISTTITWKPEWDKNVIVLDTLGGVEE